MPVRDRRKTWEFIFKNQQVNKEKENSECFWTCSIVSVERTPSSVISVSDDLRMEVILEKLFFSSFGESIKFQSSNSDATISFSCISKQAFQFKCKGKINNDRLSALPSRFELFFLLSTWQWPVLDLPRCYCWYLWTVPCLSLASLDALHSQSAQNPSQACRRENVPHSHIPKPYEGGQTAERNGYAHKYDTIKYD